MLSRMDQVSDGESRRTIVSAFFKGRIKLVFLYDIRGGIHRVFQSSPKAYRDYARQSSLRIRIYKIGAHLKQRTVPILKRVAFFLVISFIISAIFALQYEYILRSERMETLYRNSIDIAETSKLQQKPDSIKQSFENVIHSDDFPRILKNSFLIFQLWSIFTDNGQPEFLDDISSSTNGLAIDEFSLTMLLERLVGTIATACLIGSIASQFDSSMNPIWHAPKIVIDTSDSTAHFDIRYWIRYPEDKWLHRVSLVLRIRSLDSDRFSESHQFTEYFHEQNFEINRGICRLRINLEKDRNLLEVLIKMATAYQECSEFTSCSVHSDSNSVFKDYKLSKAELEAYKNYKIQFRIIGTTDEGEEISSEFKYGIEDVLFGYSLLDPALSYNSAASKPSSILNIDGMPYAKRYSYYLTWYVKEVEETKYNADCNTGNALLDGLISVSSFVYANDLSMIKRSDLDCHLTDSEHDYGKSTYGYKYSALNIKGETENVIAKITFQTVYSDYKGVLIKAGLTQCILEHTLAMSVDSSKIQYEVSGGIIQTMVKMGIREAKTMGYSYVLCGTYSSYPIYDILRRCDFMDFKILASEGYDDRGSFHYMIYCI